MEKRRQRYNFLSCALVGLLFGSKGKVRGMEDREVNQYCWYERRESHREPGEPAMSERFALTSDPKENFRGLEECLKHGKWTVNLATLATEDKGMFLIV